MWASGGFVGYEDTMFSSHVALVWSFQVSVVRLFASLAQRLGLV